MFASAHGWLVLQIASLWPVWVWYARRMVDGSDEPWGLLALAAIAWIAYRDRRVAPPSAGALRLALALMALYLAATLAPAPALIRAVLAVSALLPLLRETLDRRTALAPVWGLLVLSLPVVSSLQFFAGFPLRALTAHASAVLLGCAGLAVTPEGAALRWGERVVLVDAPCSGIHMLWVGLWLAFLLSYLARAGALRLVINAAAAVAIIVLGNIVRNTALFIKESGIVVLPDWTHEGLGVVVFVLTGLAITSAVCGRRHVD